MENMESIVSLEKEPKNFMITNLISKVLSTISSGTPYYIFLVSPKPINSINEEYFAMDDEIVEKGILGDPLKFNKIFFFDYSQKGDDSGPKKVLGVENIQSVNPLIYKGYYYLKINLENGKIYFFLFNTAIALCYWLNGLRKSIQIKQEFKKLKYGVLKYNISILYKYHQENKWVEINEVINGILNGLDSEAFIDQFLEKFQVCTSEINYFCDAFFAHKPFVQSLFEAMIKTIHSGVRSSAMDFWNKNYIEMTAGEILSFGKVLLEYRKILKVWGVVDKKLKSTTEPVVITFANRLFNNSKEIMFNVIDEAMYKFRINNTFYENDSIRILEAHINICFENYVQFPIIELAVQLVDMLMMIITIIQINLITQLQESQKNFDLEVLASLLNNDFELLVQKFMKKIHKKTKNKISINDIRKMINYVYLQRNNLKISQVCLETLNQKVSIEIENLFYSQKKPFFKFKVQKFIDSIDKKLSKIFLGLKHEHEKFDIIDKLSLQIIHLYFGDFVLHAGKLKHKQVQNLLQKIPEDHQRLLNYFRPFVGTEVDCHFEIFKDLKTFLSTDDYELTRILILKFIAFFGHQYQLPENIKKLVSAKVYFSPIQSEQMLNGFLNIREEYLVDKRRSKSVVRYVKKLNPKVRQFISILKDHLQKRKDKIRSTNLNFRPQNTELSFQAISIEQIFSFFSKCRMLEFPLETDDLQIDEFIDQHIQKNKR
jgi:hypothetical protein